MFNEKTHGYIVACFYEELTQLDEKMGRETFIIATKEYGTERGSRMAKRATAHGHDLTHRMYMSHSEWERTDDELFDVQFRANDVGDLIVDTRKCPWHTIFADMDMYECGKTYCTYIDEYLVKGFNSKLDFKINTYLYDTDCCSLSFLDADYSDESLEEISKLKVDYRDDNIRGFDYHIAHLYDTFSRVTISRHGEVGSMVLDNVNQKLDKVISKEEFDIINNYRTLEEF